MTDLGTWGPSGQDPHVHRMPTRACRAGHSPRKCPGQAAFLMGGGRGLFGSVCVTWGLKAEHKQWGLGHKGLEGVRMPAKHKGGQDWAGRVSDLEAAAQGLELRLPVGGARP